MIYGTLATGTTIDISLFNVANGWNTFTTAFSAAFLGGLTFVVGRILADISNKEHNLTKEHKPTEEPVSVPDNSVAQ